MGYGEGSLKEHNEYPKEFELPIIKVDIESEPLPFENESLETITCFEVLEHLRLDPMYAISELNRVLKPSGRLILTTPNINSYDGMLRMLNGDTPCSFARYFPHRGGIGHAKEYSVKELGELLVYAGFTIDALETFNVHRGNRFERSNLQYTDLPQFLERRGWSEALAGQHILAIAERSSAPRVRYYYPLYTRTPETEQSGAG